MEFFKKSDLEFCIEKTWALCALKEKDLLPLTSTLINGKVSSGALLDVAVIRTTQIMGNYVLD